MRSSTALSDRMRARADADQLPAAHDLRTMAQAFDDARKGYMADPPTVQVGQFVGAWTRARRAWCEYTGEALV
jgi:hypothetical protein